MMDADVLHARQAVGTVPLTAVALVLHPRDDVAIAKVELTAGMRLALDQAGAAPLLVRQVIPVGHKVALRARAPSEAVHRYGQMIGLAGSAGIEAGEHVHDHNLVLGVHELGEAKESDVSITPVELTPLGRRTFLGYHRPDDRVGTRNMVAVIATVNCATHTSRAIAHHFTAERLAPFPHVDGVIALAGPATCGMEVGGPEYVLIQRTMAGIARHPNVAASLLVGLGCETNQAATLIENYRLREERGDLLRAVIIQELGGVKRTIQAGITAIERFLPLIDTARRTHQPLTGLTVALQCGGSDAWSGVTANPLVGLVADRIVLQGGAVVCAETPEIYGAEHLLTQRAITPEVAQALLDQVRWWQARAERLDLALDNNPTVGNRDGGVSTIYEKALGAVAKGGRTPLMAVYDYGEQVTASGLSFMNTPGSDPVSVTGQVAGGCNLVLFTTGRGSAFGFKPAPSIKISSNSGLHHRMADDMDFDAGRVFQGIAQDKLADELFELVIDVASGRSSKSEAQGIGEAEFSPWCLGETL